MPDDLVLAPAASFKAPAVLSVVHAWAKQSTDPASPTHAMTVQVKTNIVMGCLDFCGKPPAAVTPHDILHYQAELETSHLKPATIYTYLQHVSSFYTWAMKVPGLQEVIKDNPVRLVRPTAPKPYSSEKTKALSDEQVAELVGLVQARADAELPPEPTDIDVMRRIVAKRDLAILLLFLTTGMRRREIIQLRWGQVELRRNGSLILRTQVKGGGRRALTVEDPAVQAALLDYLRASGRFPQMKAGSPLWTRHDRGVKGNRPGTPEPAMTSHAFYNNLRMYGKLAGVGDVHPHQTRHTFAAWVGEESGSMHAVQEALGHENEATTRHYLRAIAVEPDRYSAAIVKRLHLRARPRGDRDEGDGPEIVREGER
jgi:integrase/recombinase XerD